MFNLLIVEDEDVTREGLTSLIDWGAMGIRIAGTAENGLQALELFQNDHIDLLLTDIYMPAMDGLQLITEIRKREYDTVCVLLSGYNEFKYAQSAIRLGVSEFLVKPCSPRDIRSIFEKLIARLLKEKSTQATVKGLENQLHMNLPYVKSQILHQWLFEPPLVTDDRTEQMKKVGITISDEHIFVIVVRMDPRSLEKRIDHRTDMQLLQFATANIVQETLQYSMLQPVEVVKDQENIIAICNGLFEGTEEKLTNGLTRVINNIRLYLDIGVSIGISDSKPGINALSEAYQEAIEAMKLRFYRGYGNFYFYHKEVISHKPPALELVHSNDIMKLEQEICDNLSAGLYAEALNALEKWLSYFQEQYFQSQTQIHLRTLLFMNRLKQFVQNDAIHTDNLDWSAYDPLKEQVNRIDTLEELTGIVYRLFQQIVAMLNPQKLPKRKVQQALDIISEQYGTSGLTLGDVASTLFVSSNYLSTLFKQELGINFLDYIHRYRIEKAKALLQSGDLKIGSIARLVGYFDEAHFTKTFKKWTNTLPSQYRKDHSSF